jgi:hypothetical protein
MDPNYDPQIMRQGMQAIAQHQAAKQRMMQIKADKDLVERNFERRMSVKSKMEIARENQAYADAVSSGDYSPDQLRELRRLKTMKQMGIVANTAELARTDPYAPGQGIGQVWQENGNWWKRKANGEKEPVWTDTAKSPEGLRLKVQSQADVKHLEFLQKRELAVAKARVALSEKGYNDDEVNQKIQTAFGQKDQQQQQGGQGAAPVKLDKRYTHRSSDNKFIFDSQAKKWIPRGEAIAGVQQQPTPKGD